MYIFTIHCSRIFVSTIHRKCLNAVRERIEKIAETAYATNGVSHPIHQVLTLQGNEINRNIEGAVLDVRYGGRPENSSKALEPKKEEWLQSCDKVSLLLIHLGS